MSLWRPAKWLAGAGACFPLHFDAYNGADSRRITAIVYLNRNWTRGQGGELILHPVPEASVIIEPRFNRMVRMLRILSWWMPWTSRVHLQPRLHGCCTRMTTRGVLLLDFTADSAHGVVCIALTLSHA